MFTIEDMDEVFDRLAQMERKHTRDYYTERELMEKEQNLDRRQALEKICEIDQARAETLQVAQGLLVEVMKRRNFWYGSRAFQINQATRKWSKEQFIKNVMKNTNLKGE